MISFDGDKEKSDSNFENNKRPRFSQTQHSIQTILANKRAIRDKVDDCVPIDTPNEAGVRLFGKDFSPTIYSPEQTCDSNKTGVELDLNKFVSTILSIEYKCLSNGKLSIEDYIRNSYRFVETNGNLLSFDSLKHYKETYTPLIIYDTWAQIVESYQTKSKANPFNMIQCCALVDDQDFVFLKLKCSFTTNEILNGRHLIENWIVAISERSNPKLKPSSVFLGLVTDVTTVEIDTPVFGKPTSNTMFRFTVKLSMRVRELFQSDKQHFSAQPLYYLKPSLRLIETLTVMDSREKLFAKILKPDYDCCLFESKVESFKFVNSDQFNDSQKAAIVGCYSAIMKPFSTPKIMLIQGPPGTGKTYTLIGIVKNIFANLDSTRNPLRIMICAPSNGAIDEIGRRLISVKSFLKPYHNRSLRLVRIGQKSQIHSDVYRYSLENLIDLNIQHALEQRKNSKLKPGVDNIKRSTFRNEILLNADIILSTLSSCQQTSLELFREKISSKNAIRCLIIDEASQCSEPEILMPLVYQSITKVILIGDHLQLPATVISKTAQKLNYGRSMFERFVEYFKQDNTTHRSLPLITLNLQFRMNAKICEFPSKQFYDGKLETAPNSGVNALIPFQPYLVFDIINSIEKHSNQSYSSSKCNLIEADFVFRLLMQILNKLGYPVDDNRQSLPQLESIPFSIGIITFYRGQKSAIIERLKKSNGDALLKHVDVNTVDAFQGQERDIVILSCVRAFDPSNGTSSIGFLRSQQRLNVALTRAKYALFICISGKSFVDVPQWQQLITNAQKRQRYYRVSSKITDRQLELKLL